MYTTHCESGRDYQSVSLFTVPVHVALPQRRQAAALRQVQEPLLGQAEADTEEQVVKLRTAEEHAADVAANRELMERALALDAKLDYPRRALMVRFVPYVYVPRYRLKGKRPKKGEYTELQGETVAITCKGPEEVEAVLDYLTATLARMQ